MKKRAIAFLLAMSMCMSLTTPALVAHAEEIVEVEVDETAETEVAEEENVQTADEEEGFTGWSEDEYGSITYYIDGVMICDQLIEIDGNKYYFDSNGWLYVGYFHYSENEDEEYRAYVTDEEGVVVETPGWYEHEGITYYLDKDGYVVYDGVYTIEGKEYYFDWDGWLRTGCIEVYDEELEMWMFRLTDENGAFIVVDTPGWYTSDSGEKHYFLNSKEVARNGIYEIDGTLYGFNEHGELAVGEAFWHQVTGTLRLAGEDGTVIYEKAGTFYTIDEKKFYFIEDDILAHEMLIEVDGNKYYCYEDGVIATGAFEYWDYETDEYVSAVADSNGVIMDTAGWVEIDGELFYLDENGNICRDKIVEIDGKKYYFDEEGYLKTGIVEVYDDELEKWVYILADTEGVILEGPCFVEYDDERYFITEDDYIAKDLFVEIDGKLYYFNWDGRVEIGYFSAYDEERDEYVRYVTDEDGAIVNEPGWYEFDGHTYYIKEDGYLVYDSFYEIDGNTYYFETDGWKLDGVFSVWNSETDCYEYYLSDEDGVLVVAEEAGWYKDAYGERYYFIDTMQIAANGIYEIEGKDYLFGWDGILEEEGVFYVEEKGGYILVAADGTIVELDAGGWYTAENGVTYFVKENGLIACNEIYTIDGVDYCFEDEGELAEGRYRLYDEETDEVVTYLADEKGALIKADTGWYEYDGTTYFFKENYILASEEIVTYDGVEYIINYYGYAADGPEYIYNSVTDMYGWYLADDNGVWIKENPGFYTTEHGYTYYFKENYVIASEEIIEVDGVEYAFDEWCELCNGVFEVYDSEADVYYKRLAVEGRLITVEEPGWYKYKQEMYYFVDTMYIAAQAVVEIDGILYGFGPSGRLVRENTFYDEQNEKYILTNKDGIVITQDSGWYRQGNHTYYFKGDNILAVEELIEIDGKKYAFDYDGWMLYDTTYEYWDEETEETIYYLLDSNGAAVEGVTGWWTNTKTKTKHYFKEDGTLTAAEWLEMDGKEYYFDYNGRLMTGKFSGYNEEHDIMCYYLADDNGVVNKTPGWTKYKSNTYYIKEDGTLASGIYEIDGNSYFFDNHGGELQKGYVYYYNEYTDEEEMFITDDKGVIYKDMYVTYSRNLFYAKKDGALLMDDWSLDGQYYFNDHGAAVVGVHSIKGRLYQFDKDGKLIGPVEEFAEWKKVDGRWLYLDDNKKPYTGWINDTYYVKAGIMVIDDFVEIGNKAYYVDIKGVKQVGWIDARYGVCYADENGVLYKEWQEIDGATYYFDPYDYGRYSGLHSIEIIKGGHYIYEKHYFDIDGKYLGEITGENGWVEAYGYKFYFEDGETIEEQVYEIEGKQYYFSYLGVLATESLVFGDGKIYYADEYGVLEVLGSGWHDVEGVGKVYIDENGDRVYGMKEIDGKQYFFGHESELYSGLAYVDEWEEYVFVDNNGIIERNPDGWRYYNTKKGDRVSLYFEDGTWVDGFKVVDGKQYFFEASMMVTGPGWIFGHQYLLKEDGTLAMNEWVEFYGRYGYADESGRALVGEHEIDGKMYWFDNEGVLVGDAPELEKHVWNDGVVTKEATCTEDGILTYTCTDCGATKTYTIAAFGHTEVIDKAVEATCEEEGLTEGSHCSVCKKVLKTQETVEALGHKVVVDEAVAATCEKTGKTEGEHCSVCEKVLKVQEEVKALGHTVVIEPAVDATCITDGITEGRYCSVCKKVLAEQEIIPATGHTMDGNACTKCDYEVPVDVEINGAVNDEKAEEAVNTVKEQTGDIIGAIISGKEAADKLVSSGMISEETRTAIQDAVDSGYAVETNIVIDVLNSEEVEDSVKAAISDTASKHLGEGEQKVQLLDVSLIMQANGKELGTIDKLDKAITITIAIPDDMKAEDSTYLVLRNHDGVTEVIKTVDNGDGTVSFTTNAFSIYALVSGPKPEGILGDVNGDGSIDTSDAQAIFNHFMGIAELPADKLAFADITGEGQIDTSDAQAAFNIFMGIQ